MLSDQNIFFRRARCTPLHHACLSQKILLLADLRLIGYPKKITTQAASELNTSASDNDNGTDGPDLIGTNCDSLHHILLTSGFASMPRNEQTYGIFKKAFRVSKRLSKPGVDSNWSKSLQADGSVDEIERIDIQGSSKVTSGSRKSIVDRKITDLTVHEFRYYKHNNSAEVVVISPEIQSEKHREAILKAPGKYFMTETPHQTQQPCSIYIIRPVETFTANNIEMEMIIKCHQTLLTAHICPIDKLAELLQSVFGKFGCADSPFTHPNEHYYDPDYYDSSVDTTVNDFWTDPHDF